MDFLEPPVLHIDFTSMEGAQPPPPMQPPSESEIIEHGEQMILFGSGHATEWIILNDDLSGASGMWDWNNDGDTDWNDAAHIYWGWGMTSNGDAAWAAGQSFNNYQAGADAGVGNGE